jgi:hypothetical protein
MTSALCRSAAPFTIQPATISVSDMVSYLKG